MKRTCFLSVIGLPHELVFTLINLAVSAFALTSLDSVARVGRLSFQEFFIDDDTDEKNMSPFLRIVTNSYFSTALTLVLSYLLAKVGYAEIWPLFGSANQLLSVLTLGTTLQLIFAVLLLILGVLVAIQGVKKLMESSDKKSNKVAA